MSYTNEGKNYMLDQFASQVDTAVLYDDNETEIDTITGINWNSASDGEMTAQTTDGEVGRFDVPSNTTVNYIGLRPEGESDYSFSDIPVEDYNNEGIYVLESITVDLNEQVI